jgi:XTP/dITP diphosphohydrolase
MEIIFATHNTNKLKEVQAMMPTGIKLISLEQVGWTKEIEETGDTIEKNASIKSTTIYDKLNKPVFADDTGLLVDALDGAPGVYTARFAGAHKSDQDNMDLLLDKLHGKPRDAHFKTVISYRDDNGEQQFTGICKGEITSQRMGDHGFGYDPIFKPTGYTQTFAQMPMKEKAIISHRGQALAQLVQHLRQLVNIP